MTKINYQNLPSTSTPLNATNLNAMQNITSVVNLKTILENNWQENGECRVMKIGNIGLITLSVRYGTTVKIVTIPSGYRPKDSLLVNTYNGVYGTYAIINSTGVVSIGDTNQIGGNVVIHAVYEI